MGFRFLLFCFVIGFSFVGFSKPKVKKKIPVTFDQRGGASLGGGRLKKPLGTDFYEKEDQTIQNFLLREDVTVGIGKRGPKFELGGFLLGQRFGVYDPLDRALLQITDARNRSLLLEKYFVSKDQGDVIGVLDRANLTIKINNFKTQVGRFPIDLSKTFVFRPNDFFGPFRSNQFDRNHKLGVDALQMSYPLEPLGEVKLIGVMGYESDDPLIDDTPEASNHTSPKKSSALAYLGYTLGGTYIGLFGGKLRSYPIGGLVAEGELFSGISFRFDGNQTQDPITKEGYANAALGFDWQFWDQTFLQLEGYHNGFGVTAIEKYNSLKVNRYNPLSNLARYYASVGIAKTFESLAEARFILQQNLVDKSQLLTVNGKYPFTENFDCGITLSKPYGKLPYRSKILTEYGAYPAVVMAETGYYW